MNVRGIGAKIADESITEKSGELWDCIQRSPYRFGGSIYSFELKDKYNSLSYPFSFGRHKAAYNQNAAMYPAIEWTGEDARWGLEVDLYGLFGALDWLQNKMDSFGLPINLYRPKDWSYSRVLQHLGYRFRHEGNKVIVDLPDEVALKAGWDELRRFRPELPPLNIKSSKGVADHITFAESYISHDFLLSSGKEFFHDHIAHATRIIALMLAGSASYNYEKARLTNIVTQALRPIKIANTVLAEKNLKILKRGERTPLKKTLGKIEAALGASVDVISSYSSYYNTKMITEETFLAKLLNMGDLREYQRYWERQFGKANMSNKELAAGWQRLKEIEMQYDARKPRRVSTVIQALRT